MVQKIPVVLADDQASHTPLKQSEQIVVSAIPVSAEADNAIVVKEDGLFVPPAGGSEAGPQLVFGVTEYNSGGFQVEPMGQGEIQFGDGAKLPPGWSVENGRIRLANHYSADTPVRATLNLAITWGWREIEELTPELGLELMKSAPRFGVQSNNVMLGSHISASVNDNGDMVFTEHFAVDLTMYAMSVGDPSLGIYQSIELYVTNINQTYPIDIISAEARVDVENATGNWRIG